MKQLFVTDIYDRHEGTFLVFHRNGFDTGRLYYKPSQSSMLRLARVLTRRLISGRLKIHSQQDNKVYWYEVV